MYIYIYLYLWSQRKQWEITVQNDTCKVHLGIFKKKESCLPPTPQKNIILFISEMFYYSFLCFLNTYNDLNICWLNVLMASTAAISGGFFVKWQHVIIFIMKYMTLYIMERKNRCVNAERTCPSTWNLFVDVLNPLVMQSLN